MNIIKRAWLWLITKKENEVSEPITDTTVVTTDPAAVTTVTDGGTTVINETDAILSRLKKLVEASGAQAHAVIDDLIALAKKLG